MAGFGLAAVHGGHAIDLAEYDGLCSDCDLALVDRFATWEGAPYDGGGYAVSIHRRSTTFQRQRSVCRRLVTPFVGSPLPSCRRGSRATLRRWWSTPGRRPTGRRFGTIPGSIHVPRTVLEWRFDPASGYRHPSVVTSIKPLVVVCNHGYSSSLAAASLVHLGFTSVADLVGGMQAWIAAAAEVDHPDHTHLDL